MSSRNLSSPGVKSVTISCAHWPTDSSTKKISSPVPPVSRSRPPPPSKKSAPALPMIASSPAEPKCDVGAIGASAFCGGGAWGVFGADGSGGVRPLLFLVSGKRCHDLTECRQFLVRLGLVRRRRGVAPRPGRRYLGPGRRAASAHQLAAWPLLQPRSLQRARLSYAPDCLLRHYSIRCTLQALPYRPRGKCPVMKAAAKTLGEVVWFLGYACRHHAPRVAAMQWAGN